MAAIRRTLARLWTIARSGRAEAELAREIESHLRLLEDGFIAQGMSPDDARYAARRAFGGVEQAKERQRDERSLRAFHDLFADLRYAVRVLRRAPGFTLAAVTTLALGIGASTAIFSVAYGVLLRPLPYPEPDRLIRIYEANAAKGELQHDVSLGSFQAWREGAPSIEAAAAYGKVRTHLLASPSEPQAVTQVSVSPAFFDVLGVKPLLGPGFKPEREYTRFTGEDEAIISYGAWQRLFNGRPDVIGQQLEITGVRDNQLWRIVGVMPAGFAFDGPVDVWQPSNIVELPVRRLFRTWRYDRVVARLRPGATLEQARAELETVSAWLAGEFPASNAGWNATAESLHASIVGGFARAAWLLLAAVAVVLLVACLNVGGLLAARAVARQRETAIRIALGAGSWRLGRLWIAEASLLIAIGASLGTWIAILGVSALKAASPSGVPRLDAIAVDADVLALTAAASVLAVLVCAAGPLAVAWRQDPGAGLKTGSASAGDGPRRQRVRAVLTMTQCAGAVALVVLAVLLTRSVVNLLSVDLGWEPAGVVALRLDPPMPRDLDRPWARYVEWADRLMARLEADGGVEAAAVTTQIPLSPWFHQSNIARGRGRAAGDLTQSPAVTHVVSDAYFATMGIRLTRGRTFGVVDRFSTAQLIGADGVDRERGVAIVTESAARTLWPGADPVGKAIWLPDIDNVTWREVVGVVEDIQFYAIGERPILHVFVPWTQTPSGNPRVVVRGAGSAADTIALVRSVAAEVEPGTHADQMASLETLASEGTAQPRFTSRVVALFGVLALTLAAVGIYGMLSCIVRSRTGEIGIRLALGASPRHILSHTLWHGLLPALGGGACGLIAAFGIARTFRAIFFGLSPADPWSFFAGAVALVAVALIAALGPARRASRVDPAHALQIDR